MNGTDLTAYMVVRDWDTDTEWRWHGGEYIEHGSTVNGEWTAHDVINVWDYETDSPRIPRTLEALETAIREWLGDQS